MSPKQRPSKSTARQYAESVGIALILAIVMRSSFVQAYVIPSGSMEPTILVGDHIFVNKLAYGLRIPDSIAGILRRCLRLIAQRAFADCCKPRPCPSGANQRRRDKARERNRSNPETCPCRK